ncbi:hypothetical protein ACTXJU_15645 [Glutamicibacter ardleyensis]|uniref:hypothetical protein n=1 Tax=Glutamicibacter ardleyensis TaxID=225894 RepID=UPI003FD37FCA
MKKLAPLALVAALALTGCAPKALEVAPGPSHVPAGSPVAVSVAEPTSKAVKVTPSATSSAPHVAPNTGIKFSGATAELKELAFQEYTAWDEINSKDNERFRGAYKAGHVVMLPKIDPGLEGEFVKILEWSAPSENEIVVRIEGNEWSSLDLRTPPGTVSCALIGDDRNSFTATFVSEDGKTSGNMECKNMP